MTMVKYFASRVDMYADQLFLVLRVCLSYTREVFMFLTLTALKARVVQCEGEATCQTNLSSLQILGR